jgi:hypothetical protein
MDNSQNHSTVKICLCQLPVGKLGATQPYQAKRYYPSSIKNIIDNFDILLVGVIAVHELDGAYHIIDGKHRTTGAKKKFGDDYLINCIVYSGITYEEAARMYAMQYDNTKRLAPSHRFLGMLEAKDNGYTDMNRIVEKAGLTIADSSNNDGIVRCVALLKKAYDQLGSKLFAEFIGLLVGAWKGKRESLDKQVIGGVLVFFKTYQDTFDRRRFVDKLKKVDPPVIIREGLGDTSARGDTRFAKIILREYNKMSTEKSRLPYKFNG